MTIEEIKTRIRDIEDCSGDHERQHAKEDEMVWDFIEALADPVEHEMYEDIPTMAKALLESKKLEFNRWCA